MDKYTIDGSDGASPALISARENTIKFVRAMDTEFGLLSAEDATERFDISLSELQGLQDNRKILWIEWEGRTLYPGYQFDSANSYAVFPFVEALLMLAEEREWSVEGVAMWMCCGSYRLGGERPVDYLNDPHEIIATANNAWSIW